MPTDNYSASTARAAYFPSSSNALARLWAREKMLHDFADLGAAEFFEGAGTNPTTISGYSKSKLWLQVDAGVTTTSGTLRVYTGGTESDVANWPSVSDFGRGAFASHIGVTGADLDYVWTTSTSGDPGAGKVRADNATLASATTIAISKTGRQGQAYTNRILTWDDATTTGNRGRLSFYDLTDPTVYIEFRVSGAITDAGTYYTVPVTSIVSGSLTNGRLLGVNFARTGDKGEEGVGAAGITIAFKDTRANAASTTFGAGINVVHVYGYDAVGDLGECTYYVDTVTSTGAFQTPDGRWWRPISPDIRPEQFGAVADGVTDDISPVQTAVDLAIDRNLAGQGVFKVSFTGRHAISSPVKVFRLNGGSAFHWMTLTLEGAGGTPGYVSGRTSGLISTNVNMPAIAVNSARQVRIANLNLLGPNGTVLPSYAQLTDDSVSPWWNASSMRDTQYSPCAGIVIDPFKTGGVPADGGYSGWSSFYVENRGSSLVDIDNVTIAGFIVGILLSPSGLTQNNDGVTITRCQFLGNKYPISIGQDQCRDVVIRDAYCLGAKCFVTGRAHGAQIGVMPTLDDCLIDYCQYVLNFASGRGPGIVRNCFFESTLAIGSWATGGFPLDFENCWFKLVRPDLNSTSAVGVVLANGAPVHFRGGALSYYSNTPERAHIVNDAVVTFDGISCDDVPVFAYPDRTVIENMPLRYMGQGATYGARSVIKESAATAGSSSYDIKIPVGGRLIEFTSNLVERVYGNNEGIITEVVETTTITTGVSGTATFTAADAGAYAVGDYLATATTYTIEIGPDLTDAVGGKVRPLGRVESVVGTTITLKGVPKSLATGSYAIQHQRLPTFRLRSVGDVTSGSTSVTNVKNVSTWRIGQRIRGAGIPTGTYVSNIVTTTITLSRQATATSTQTPLYDGWFDLTGKQRYAVGAPSTGVWFKGDELTVTDVSVAQPDANNLIFDRYRCLASGEAGTWATIYGKTTSP